jgi:hypothetical protein
MTSRTEAPGRGISLREGDVNLHTVTCGGGYVWCGCSTRPSRLVRLSPDLTDYETILLEGTNGLHDLCWDGHHIWAAHSSGHLSQVEPSGEVCRTLQLHFSGDSPPFAYACDHLAEDIWVGMYTDPGCVLRVGKDTGEIREYRIPEASLWSIRDVAFAAGKVWAPLYDVPGRVVAIDPENGKQDVISLGEKHILPSTLAAIGNHVWVGLDTLPARLVRIDAASGETRSFAFAPLSSSCRALAVDDGTLWVALYTEPAKILRLDVVTGEWEVIDLPEGFSNSRAMAHDDAYLFIGLQNRRHQPSTLYRLPLSARGLDIRQPGIVKITAQDWYRVRRGEDQLAWGLHAAIERLPGVVLSKRAGEEFAFLDNDERARLADCLRNLVEDKENAPASVVEGGDGWLLSRVGELRVVVRRSVETSRLQVATIRRQEGVSFDPENLGPPPVVEGISWKTAV